MAAAITAAVVMISNGGGTKALNRGKAIPPSECGGADEVASENWSSDISTSARKRIAPTIRATGAASVGGARRGDGGDGGKDGDGGDGGKDGGRAAGGGMD